MNATSTENAAAFDGAALLSALRTLPISTYDLAGARHIGPMGGEFNAAFGLGGGSDVALGDLSGVALATAKELATQVTAAGKGAPGPAGASGEPGAKGATGDAGPAGATDADHTPSAAALAAFNARLDTLTTDQAIERRRLADLRKRIKR